MAGKTTTTKTAMRALLSHIPTVARNPFLMAIIPKGNGDGTTVCHESNVAKLINELRTELLLPK
jgi:hypothetical protein